MFLYYLIIAPIEMIVEWVFYFFVKVEVGGVITAVFGVSVVINFLALPLYNIADALQDKERQISRRLEPRLKRIRKAFKGDEQFMMISTYYRQNDYHPLYVLRSSLSILIEIPFFIAAYHFLSHCPMLLGEHFWIFKDLGSPDRMWTITLGSLSLPINILPIIMTAINVVSAAVYTRGGTVKEKVQIYALAAVFLVLLYESPSGLVIYWILNNLFSLAKNVIQKMKHPKTVLSYIIGIVFILGGFILLTALPQKFSFRTKFFAILIGVFFVFLPTLFSKLSNNDLTKTLLSRLKQTHNITKSDFFIFIFSALGLSILLGMLLPASVIATSPTEFSFLGKTESPLSYIYSSIWTFCGLCVFWPTCIYFMFSSKIKNILCIIMPTLLICALCNVYIFKADYGDFNAMFLIPEANRPLETSILYRLFSLLIFVVSAVLIGICRHYKSRTYLSITLFSLCLGMSALSLYKTSFINQEYTMHRKSVQKSDKTNENGQITPVYHLSRDKQNVVILFLDRAMGCFLPLILQEFPDLKTTFSGFTFYPNTVSLGRNTNTGVPPMVGGYEYAPDKINERNKELLKDKHNEACLIMPKIFSDAGFEATVTDMPWLNYSYNGDLSVFDDYPNIHASCVIGNQVTNYYLEKRDHLIPGIGDIKYDNICRSKIRLFSLVQSLYPQFRKNFYEGAFYDVKKMVNVVFLYNFSQLYFLPRLTDFTSDKPTYTFITNNTTHEFNSLNVPEYDTLSISDFPDYGSYKPAYRSDNLTINKAYQTNTAALLQVAKWLKYLQESKVYDNTRVIIVADHGCGLKLDELYPLFKESDISSLNPAANNPLLMFKDFNSKSELNIDKSFMTNADTIFLATKDLPISDINPFTGNKFIPNKDNGVIIHLDTEWNATTQRQRTTFLFNPNEGYIIKHNLFDPANWTPITSGK